MTWYHLVSRIADPPQKRDNGRTRGCLPVGTPAPRPCSADPDLPHHTNRGSLKGFACLLFSSQLLSTIHGHYSLKVVHLSTVKFQFVAPSTLLCHCEPVRTLAWQSPGTMSVPAWQVDEWYQEIPSSAILASSE